MTQAAKKTSNPLEFFRPDLPEYVADPYPYYREIRKHPSPHIDDFGNMMIWHYHAAAAALKMRTLGMESGQRVRAAEDTVPLEARAVMDRWILLINPPDHTRIRSLMAKTFQPRNLEALDSRIATVAKDLLAAMKSKSDPDLVRDFTYPYPVHVICSILGIPRDDWDSFTDRSETAGRSIDPTPLNEKEQEAVAKNFRESSEYFMRLIDSKRKHPGDDLASKLVRDMDDEGVISEEELAANLGLLFGAGHETTSNMLGNGFVALAQKPEQWQALQADASLAAKMVEEALRYDSSVQITGRTALEDCEIDGCKLAKGASVLVLIGAANRDESVFEDAENFDITKDRQQATLSFGGGIHHCLGAHLTRMEGRIAIPMLAETLRPQQIPAPSDLERLITFTLRGYRDIPLG